jgi:flagellar hook-associated protein 3 FlgL
MRVANNNIFNAVTRNVMRNQERFLELSETVASGKRVHKLSTDPPALGQMLRFRTTVSTIEQYQQNIDRANSWLSLSETSLTQAEDVLMRAKELALSQTTGSASTDSREAAAVEVDILLQQIIEAGNAKVGNQFLFAGRKTNAAPFRHDGTYQGDGGALEFEIGQQNFMTINTPGDVIFKGSGGGIDVLNVLQDLKTALEAGDQAGIEALLTPLDQGLNQVLAARTGVGAKMSRLTTAKDKLTETSDHLTQMLGETEGADLAKTISDLTQQEFVYQASLAASAKMVQPTLLNFLR